jgi:hypothetical protein
LSRENKTFFKKNTTCCVSMCFRIQYIVIKSSYCGQNNVDLGFLSVKSLSGNKKGELVKKAFLTSIMLSILLTLSASAADSIEAVGRTALPN